MNRKSLALAFCLVAAPAVAGAQSRGGITRIELLALQQQMRDEGCGNRRAPGVWNAETRRAIVTCAKKHNSSTNARELLAAMNVGFASNDNSPRNGMAAAGGDTGMNLGSERGNNVGARSTTTTTTTPRTTNTTTTTTPVMRDSTMTRDSTMMRDSTMKRDSTAKRDSTTIR